MRHETADHELDQQMCEDIEPYRVMGVLGYGGMGAVYLAEDPNGGGRKVAIKAISISPYLPPAQRQRLRSRLQEEAHALGQIKHPGVPTLYHVIDKESAFYVVMEYVEGKSLAELLGDKGTLSTERAVEVACAVLDALSAAHAKGLVHRDIKPSNIMICPDGMVKLIDFGLAKSTEISEHITRSDVSPGTPGYMAPEQVAGKRATPASDIFCLGVVLYEMLSGRRPFEGESHTDLAFSILYEAPLDLGESAAGLPEPLTQAVMRALARVPSDRYRSASEMATTLRTVLSPQKPTPAPLPPDDSDIPVPQVPLKRRRWPVLAGGVAACVLALLAAVHFTVTRRVLRPVDEQETAVSPGGQIVEDDVPKPGREGIASSSPEPGNKGGGQETGKGEAAPPPGKGGTKIVVTDVGAPSRSEGARSKGEATGATQPAGPSDSQPSAHPGQPSAGEALQAVHLWLLANVGRGLAEWAGSAGPPEPGDAPLAEGPPAQARQGKSAEEGVPGPEPAEGVAVVPAEELKAEGPRSDVLDLQSRLAEELRRSGIPVRTVTDNSKAVVRILSMSGEAQTLGPDQLYPGMGPQRQFTYRVTYRIWKGGDELRLCTTIGQSPESSRSLEKVRTAALAACARAMANRITHTLGEAGAGAETGSGASVPQADSERESDLQ